MVHLAALKILTVYKIYDKSYENNLLYAYPLTKTKALIHNYNKRTCLEPLPQLV